MWEGSCRVGELSSSEVDVGRLESMLVVTVVRRDVSRDEGSRPPGLLAVP